MLVTSCVEEIPLEIESFESVLIVEATITNTNKQQEILLSRSYRFDSIPVQESNATVIVTDDAMNTYTFSETTSGKYVSQTVFSAQPERNYSLSITTFNGKKYASNEMKLTQPTLIDNLYVEGDFNENGIEGASIYVDSYDPTGNSKYYRHEYEETYKIISPLYSTEELLSNGIEFPILQEDQPDWESLQDLIDFLVTIQSRTEQEQICYNTINSNNLNLISTTDFGEDRLNKYRVRFLGKGNSEIRHRYSILVRQFVQSREAYVFYETLSSFAQSENVFSENQPGFLEGNIFSVNHNETIFGFFEVASVDEKRLFFNFEDVFPNQSFPPHFVDCDEYYTPALIRESLDQSHMWINSPLVDAINSGFQFYEENNENFSSPLGPGPFNLVLGPCGDCTFLGNNNVPDFWED
ncbi:MAG: hypothetical protein DA407_07700 [Bacteroidetes bacterium]|nr:MAG: hypothetical protein DA407_07700 [Bacteroidota bacterium]